MSVPNGEPPADLPDDLTNRLIAQERAIYDEKERNLISALLDLPGRSTAMLTVCAAVATLLASSAIIELNSSTPQSQRDNWLPYVFIAFVLVVVSIGVSVWLTLGALMPVRFAEFEPKDFVREAQEPMRNRLAKGLDHETAIHDYMADIVSKRVEENAIKLKKKQSNILCAVWILRFAFIVSIVLFAFGVIIRAGGVDTIMKVWKGKHVQVQGKDPKKSGATAASENDVVVFIPENSIIDKLTAHLQLGKKKKSSDPVVKGKIGFRSPRSGEWITSGTIVDVTEQRRRQ